jgi:hypothetical protein
MNFEFKNVVMQILKFFTRVYDNQRCHQDFNLLGTIILIIHHLSWIKMVHH